MAEFFALYLAGLSFFFTGVSGISENLRALSGQQFRRLLSKSTKQPVIAGLLGMVLGAFTQSSSVVAFILSGMTASGLIPMSRALMVLSCASVGTALLVFIATLDLHLPILFLIGISGLILAFQLFHKARPAFAGLLSLGLVFFGLDMMKQVFKPLSSSHEFAAAGQFLDYWPDAAFFVGMLMRTVIHSSSAVAAITVSATKGGALDEFPAMLSMAGLGVGTAIATYLLSSNLKGIPRQISLYQAATNSAAGVLLALLLIFEHLTRIPMLMAFVDRLASSQATRSADMYFAFNLLILFLSLATLRWAPAWLQRMSPPTIEQDLSRPQFLQTEALSAPETALDLVGLEQDRFLRALTRYLAVARGETSFSLVPLHESALILNAEIAGFLEALVGQQGSSSLTARALSFQRKQETLRSLEDNVFLFSKVLEDAGGEEQLGGRLVEGLDTILLTATEALAHRDAFDISTLVQLTEDRGSMMERIRKQIKLDGHESVANAAALHYATTLFERNVWLLRQLALWVRQDAETLKAAA